MFEPYSLFLGIVFSLIGTAAWRYGRRENNPRHLFLAVGLFLIPFVLQDSVPLAVCGGVMTFLLFWP